METFVWDSHFITDIEKVDQQHQGLVLLFNRLSASLDGCAPEEERLAPRAVYNKLQAYARRHFADEEALMERVGLDARFRQHHREAHQVFIAQLEVLWRARKSLDKPADIFLTFLTSWLALHVLGMDQSMARQIARVQAGESAARAFDDEDHPQDHSVQAMLKAMGNIYRMLSRLNVAFSTHQHALYARTRELEELNTQLRQANRQLAVHARTDGLLAIANRTCFEEQLEKEWQRAMRSHDALGLLIIDVDDFKRYNDAYGHPAGDICLRAVVDAVGACQQRSTDLLARYGGEELALLLPHTDAGGAMRVARAVCAAVAQLQIEHRDSRCAPHVTVSVGVASVVPTRHSDAAQLVRAADAALYQAKDQGRNRVCLG